MISRRHLRAGVAAAAATCASGAFVGTVVGVAVAAIVAVAATAASMTFLRIAVSHCRLTRRLRSRSKETQVAGTRLRLGSVGGSVFVAGLHRPAIFCDGALLGRLDDAELVAVLLHERAHQVARDPLRSAVRGVVAPVLGRSRWGQEWLHRHAAVREIAADRYALAHGADRRAIASALLKIPAAGAAPASAFAPAAELRMRALLGDDVPVGSTRSWAITMGIVVGSLLCLAMLHPAAQAMAAIWACCPV